MKASKLKVIGLLFAVGCITTVIPTYQLVTGWWQQAYSSAVTVS